MDDIKWLLQELDELTDSRTKGHLEWLMKDLSLKYNRTPERYRDGVIALLREYNRISSIYLSGQVASIKKQIEHGRRFQSTGKGENGLTKLLRQIYTTLKSDNGKQPTWREFINELECRVGEGIIIEVDWEGETVEWIDGLTKFKEIQNRLTKIKNT